MATSTITVGSNQTVTFDATSNALNSTVDFTGTSGNLDLQNLSASNPLALTITGNFGGGISNVLTFGTADNVSISNSSVSCQVVRRHWDDVAWAIPRYASLFSSV
ncbi:hypothetical protein ACJRO0_03180, partial [Acetobacter oryzifermentans]